ncbi:unnamed protein product [Closterium sp. Naga37s-1]|nr:unnamed protein product [Closterium sp. Naga37s-1]
MGGGPFHWHAYIPSPTHPLSHTSYPIPMYISLFPNNQEDDEEESSESVTKGEMEKGDEEEESTEENGGEEEESFEEGQRPDEGIEEEQLLEEIGQPKKRQRWKERKARRRPLGPQSILPPSFSPSFFLQYGRHPNITRTTMSEFEARELSELSTERRKRMR